MDFTKTKHGAIGPQGRRDLMDLKHHIHCLETEAYSAVLKAFIAQSDLLTWSKEELMTDLRKELNVTDSEHGEILMAVNSDESVKRIREQRKLASHHENYVKVNKPGNPAGAMLNSLIRMKTSSPVAYFLEKNMSHCQSSRAAIHIPSSKPVEKMLLNRENPDPVVIDKAKSTLREQERAILEALAKLADVLERHDPSN